MGLVGADHKLEVVLSDELVRHLSRVRKSALQVRADLFYEVVPDSFFIRSLESLTPPHCILKTSGSLEVALRIS